MMKAEIIMTKRMNDQIDKQKGQIRLNDIGFRLIMIPFFGIAIPLITKMAPFAEMNPWMLKLSFLYNIGLAWVIWEGNKFLLYSLRNYFDWYNKPLQKIGALLFVVPFYTIPLCVLLLSGWYNIFYPENVNWDKIWLATSIILICVVFIVHVYETVFLVKESESEKMEIVQLEKLKMEAELKALKSQIDPHFIFNSLNTLSYFIEEQPGKAVLFNQYLADVYRYLLQNKTKNLVTLKEELDFVKDYFALLSIRFEEAIKLSLNIDERAQHSHFITPISIQILLENAVKHNRFSDQEPLEVSIVLSDNKVEVVNSIRRKNGVRSSKIGLQNLNDRNILVVGKPIDVSDNDFVFSVKVPLVDA